MIEIRTLNFDYPNGVRALTSVDLDIEQGDFVFLAGPTGAGKSTLLKLLHLQLKPTSGSIRLGGVNLERLTTRDGLALRRKIGFVFQDFKLLDDRTVYDNIAYVLEVVGAHKRDIRKKTARAINLVGLAHKTYKKVEHLSCGEQQRVAIARAIANQPDLLLADEPTGHMDQATGWEIMQIFQKIHREGTTVVVATHNQTWVERLNKRVVTLFGGKIVEETEGKGVKTNRHVNSILLRT